MVGDGKPLINFHTVDIMVELLFPPAIGDSAAFECPLGRIHNYTSTISRVLDGLKWRYMF